MITRKVPGSHICLRCRHALAKLSAPASTNHLRYASHDSSQNKYSPSTKEELERDNYRNRSSRRESRFSGDDVGAKPFGKLYGHHGQARRAALEDLNTKSLNDPAKAIVLRDTIFNFYTYDKVALKPQLAEHIDIEQQLNEERGLVGQDEVNENITSLKPKLGQEPSSWDDINALVRDLQDGFTTSQLEKYIELYSQSAADINEIQWEESIKESSIVRTTPWLPGTSETEHAFDSDPLRGYFLDSHTGKQRIALRLLRNCWHVELPELAEGIGQFEIEVNPDDLDLLLLGSPSTLDAICRQDLTFEHEKMEVFRARNVLRVTTVQHKRRWIISEIEKALSNVSRSVIDLRDIIFPANVPRPDHSAPISQKIDQRMLDELSHLTNCSIIRKDEKSIEVSYLGKRGDESKSSTSKMEDVRRLLVSSVHAPTRIETQLAHSMSNTSNTAFVKCPVSLTSSLPWFKRNRSWSRWTAPIGVLNTPEATLAQNTSAKTPKDFETPAPSVPITAKSISEKPDDLASGKTHIWNQRYFTETSALVGTILHEDNASEIENSWAPRHKEGTSEKEHAFSTNIPNVSRILSGENVHVRHNGRASNNLVLRFVPNPFFMPANPRTGKKSKKPLSVGPQAFSAFPPIEMRFEIDADTRDTKLKDIRALVHDTRTDVMLPDNLVDTRFEQLTISRLRRRYLKQVEQYIKASKLSLSDGIIEPAATIKFPISDHLVQQPGIKILGTGRDTKEDNREIEYLFAGLEIRSTLEHNWMGWLLHYTSIKGGRAAGSRSELRLHPIRNDERVGEEDFVKAAYQLADLVGGGDPNTAADFVPRLRKPKRVLSKGANLIRKFETAKGTTRMNFEYFVKRLGISTVPGKESETLVDGEAESEAEMLTGQSAVLDYEVDEGDIEDHEDHAEGDLVVGRQLEVEGDVSGQIELLERERGAGVYDTEIESDVQVEGSRIDSEKMTEVNVLENTHIDANINTKIEDLEQQTIYDAQIADSKAHETIETEEFVEQVACESEAHGKSEDKPLQ